MQLAEENRQQREGETRVCVGKPHDMPQDFDLHNYLAVFIRVLAQARILFQISNLFFFLLCISFPCYP
jgi:hypothetical protein